MTIAQCKAARRCFKIKFRDQGKIGRPVYPSPLSLEASVKREMRYRARKNAISGRRGAKK